MVKVIMDEKGSGKTKDIIKLINTAAEAEKGNSVCISKGSELTYDISYRVRLVQSKDYGINNFEILRGFIYGLHAGNYDITHIFIDGLCKIVKNATDKEVEDFLDACEAFSNKEGVKFTITISSDAGLATPGIKKYF